MITGYGTVESAVTAIKLGAYDYLTKPFDMDKLLKVVENVSEKFFLSEEIRCLKEKLQAYVETPEMISVSDKMHRIFELIEKLAPIDCNVLIQGESGTGKGLVAQQIHRRSPRHGHPWSWWIAPPSVKPCWKVNCSDTSREPLPGPMRIKTVFLK